MRGKAILLAALLVVSMVATAAMPAAAQPQANGTVSISANPASDGSSYDYAINDESAASNLSIKFTGRDNKINQSRQLSAGSNSISVGGTKDPVNETISFNSTEGVGTFQWYIDVTSGANSDYWGTELQDVTAYDSDGNVIMGPTDIQFGDYKSPGTTVKNINFPRNTNNIDYTISVDTGAQIDHNWQLSYQKGDKSKTDFDGTYIIESGSSTGDISVGKTLNDPAYEVKHQDFDVNIDGTSTSFSGTSGSKSVALSQSTDAIDVSGTVPNDLSLSYREVSETRDPTVSINGNETGVSGKLSDGASRSLSVSDDWIKSGRNNITVTTNDPADGPGSVVRFEYEHDAARSIDTSATSTQFESTYNISHTYRNATNDATVILPFDSGRVINLHTIEYRLNGGQWKQMDSADYDFNNSGATSGVTADISSAHGSELSEDTTADVRSTARKIGVENGAVTVTEPTAPGDELDTQLSIDSKSEGFQINVGPTESGSRVHYGLSDDFGGTGPTGSAVIEANGDQHVQFPNALAGDSVRMKHLRTQVKPQSGDVRIDVQEAGSDPKIDVSPGPGGEGDPVDIKYYRTQTGSEYILESLTQGIVLDSDTAESPAIFSDDDSEETWLIALGTVGGDGDTEEGEGIIGPVQQSTGFEIPFSGSVQPLLALLAIGALATVYFRGPDGFAYFSRAGGRAASATRSSIPIVGGLLGRLFGAIGTALSYGFGGLVRLAGFARSRPRLTAGVAGVASMAAVAFGVIPLPIELVFAAGVPLVSFVLLREIGQFNVTVWAVTSVAAFLGSLVALGVSFDGLINEQTSLILAVGGLYIAYQVVQVWRQGQITEVVVPGRGNDDDDE